MEQTGIKIYKVLPNQLAVVWPDVRKYLVAAIKKSHEQKRCNIEALLIDIINDDAQLIIAVDDSNKIVSAVVLIECEQYNGVSICIYLMGGVGMSKWVDQMHDYILGYAKSIGAKWIDTCTRHGIGGVLEKKFNYKQKNVFYTLEV